MKKFLLLLVAFATISCGSNSSNSNKAAERAAAEAAAKREQFVKDSIARVEFVRDSIAKAEVIKRCEPLFTVKKDEFSDKAWVEPKSAPKYRNRNGVYAYFATENGRAFNFRFVYQYYSDDWLFIKNMIFNIDGENITIAPDMETDCGNGGKIWEWCDVHVTGGDSESIFVNEYFIKKIAEAKAVKVKMNGRQYYDTRTLTSAQIQSIKDTYEYYKALGGIFD